MRLRWLAATLACARALAWAEAHGAQPPASSLEAVVLPSHVLAADGETVHLLRLYLIEGDTLVAQPPQVTAARGAVVEPPRPAPDGGWQVRYRPPRVSAPGHDTLQVAVRARSL